MRTDPPARTRSVDCGASVNAANRYLPLGQVVDLHRVTAETGSELHLEVVFHRDFHRISTGVLFGGHFGPWDVSVSRSGPGTSANLALPLQFAPPPDASRDCAVGVHPTLWRSHCPGASCDSVSIDNDGSQRGGGGRRTDLETPSHRSGTGRW